MTGDHHDGQRGAHALDLTQDVEPVHAGHRDVQEDRIGFGAAEEP